MAIRATSAALVDPQAWEPDVYVACVDCERFTACPCGCGWGACDQDPTTPYNAKGEGCHVSEGAERRA